MKHPIIGLIKKDFILNWKVVCGFIILVIGAVLLEWADVFFGGPGSAGSMEESLEGDYLVLMIIVTAAGSLPINQSFAREDGVSTRAYLRSLPVTAKDIFTANLLTSFIYGTIVILELLAIMSIFHVETGFGIFLVMSAANLFIASVYIFLNYTFGFHAAQIFYLGGLVTAIFALGFGGLNQQANGWLLQREMGMEALLLSVCLLLAAAALFTILIKKKRRL